MLEFQRLYPQYNIMPDRRKDNVAVPFERRSGVERRAQDRVNLDTTLTRDLFEVKHKISQMQKTNPLNFAQDVSKAASSNLSTDQFVRTTKPQDTEPVKKTEPPSTTGIAAGVLGVVLAGVLAGAFFGVTGAVMAVGLGIYVGGKALKNAIVEQITESRKKDMEDRKK